MFMPSLGSMVWNELGAQANYSAMDLLQYWLHHFLSLASDLFANSFFVDCCNVYIESPFYFAYSF